MAANRNESIFIEYTSSNLTLNNGRVSQEKKCRGYICVFQHLRHHSIYQTANGSSSIKIYIIITIMNSDVIIIRFCFHLQNDKFDSSRSIGSCEDPTLHVTAEKRKWIHGTESVESVWQWSHLWTILLSLTKTKWFLWVTINTDSILHSEISRESVDQVLLPQMTSQGNSGILRIDVCVIMLIVSMENKPCMLLWQHLMHFSVNLFNSYAQLLAYDMRTINSWDRIRITRYLLHIRVRCMKWGSSFSDRHVGATYVNYQKHVPEKQFSHYPVRQFRYYSTFVSNNIRIKHTRSHAFLKKTDYFTKCVLSLSWHKYGGICKIWIENVCILIQLSGCMLNPYWFFYTAGIVFICFHLMIYHSRRGETSHTGEWSTLRDPWFPTLQSESRQTGSKTLRNGHIGQLNPKY